MPLFSHRLWAPWVFSTTGSPFLNIVHSANRYPVNICCMKWWMNETDQRVDGWRQWATVHCSWFALYFSFLVLSRVFTSWRNLKISYRPRSTVLSTEALDSQVEKKMLPCYFFPVRSIKNCLCNLCYWTPRHQGWATGTDCGLVASDL